MTFLRRGALRATLTALALVVPATAWWFVNTWAYDGTMRLNRIRNDELVAALTAKAAAAGRPAPQFVPEQSWWYATGWTQHWQSIGPGLFLLIGAALLAVGLRRAVRGAWWVLPAAAPAFAAGFPSAGEAAVQTAAGWGVSRYTAPGPSFANQGLHLGGLHGPAWLLWVIAATGWAMVLLPAASTRMRSDARGISWLGLKVSVLVASVTGVAVALAQYLNSDSGPVGIGVRGFAGAAFLVLAGAILLHGSPRRLLSAALFALAAWALVVGMTSVTAGQLANAALYAAALLAAAALSLVPWHEIRERLNGRGTADGQPAAAGN
ncbi:MAG: hypothetical protein QOK14_259 [Frankiaceae bacterium]|nr:hypothetical protein [Frankiaceae bacterium]